MKQQDQPAFPIALQNGLSHDSHVDVGLTKREYFAAMAMQGMVADPNNNGRLYEIAVDAVNYADALIEALNNKP